MITVNTQLQGTQWHDLAQLRKELHTAFLVDVFEKYVFTGNSNFHIPYPINIILK